jgi:hypothetical protein
MKTIRQATQFNVYGSRGGGFKDSRSLDAYCALQMYNLQAFIVFLRVSSFTKNMPTSTTMCLLRPQSASPTSAALYLRGTCKCCDIVWRILTLQLLNAAHSWCQHCRHSSGWRVSGQATLYLFQKHLLCRECIIYHSVMLGHVIKTARTVDKRRNASQLRMYVVFICGVSGSRLTFDYCYWYDVK